MIENVSHICDRRHPDSVAGMQQPIGPIEELSV
jgi:hypothetical protein